MSEPLGGVWFLPCDSCMFRGSARDDGFFRLADDARREQGWILDRLGFGPQSLPSRTVRTWRALHLVAHQGAKERQPAMLIVPAPIKTPYIWDLAPGSSAVERCLSAGLQVYMAAWQRPQAGDESMGLAEYGDEAIFACLEEIRAETGQAKVFLAGHSLGGTLAAIFASLHPQRTRGLIALEGPIEFGAGRLEAAVASGPSASAIAGAFGNVPGAFLDLASGFADPVEFNAGPWFDWLQSAPSPAANRLHWQVRRWSLDESPMAGRLFEEVAEMLYRDNRFAERRLRVGGRLADPRALDMPIIAVLDPRSRIVPRASIEAYRTSTGSKDVQLLEYRGDAGVMLQHVGVLVGRNAHDALWPRILAWVKRSRPDR